VKRHVMPVRTGHDPANRLVVRADTRRVIVVAMAALATVLVLVVVLGQTPEKWVDNPRPKSSSFRWKLSTALADAAILFLAVTLAYGAVRVLAGRKPAVHLPWRRPLGVAAAMLALAHLGIGLSVHGNVFQPWFLFVTDWPSGTRPLPLLWGSRGAANWLGLTAAIVLMALAVISNGYWLRRLGSLRWKTVQRLTYVVFALVGTHAFFYWRVERRLVAHRAIVLSVIAVTISLQLAAFAVVQRRRCLRPRRARAGTVKGTGSP
jgi:DMSO/TMAO reductase YedYZ heme-binding membrane subunit